MKEKSKKIRFVLETKLSEIIKSLEKDYSSLVINDLYVQINKSRNTLSIYDGQKKFLKQIYLEEIFENSDYLDFFYSNGVRLIKEAAINCRSKKLFEQANFLPPLTLLIADEEEHVLLNFILMDTDRIYTEEKLLKDLDKELDSFIKNLLSDIE
ncbi:MAG: hypothetical protein LUG18_04710 [Candidatus Azobacteroides sp.]|nr:hypothetical protein [Candidatus Azobacteroides sp.]